MVPSKEGPDRDTEIVAKDSEQSGASPPSPKERGTTHPKAGDGQLAKN